MKSVKAFFVAAFVLAAGAAVASAAFAPVQGWSKFNANPALNPLGQTVPCVARKVCSDDITHPICQVNLQRQSDGAIVPFQLFGLQTANNCPIIVYEP